MESRSVNWWSLYAYQHLQGQQPGYKWKAAYKRWMHVAMAELGFPEVYFIGLDMIYQEPATTVVQPRHFTPTVSLCFTLMMQGPCLFPFTLEKQTALQSVLEPLMASSADVGVLNIEQVTYVPPIQEHLGNASGATYFFINVSVACGKGAGKGFKSDYQVCLHNTCHMELVVYSSLAE
eukprot:jgi/Botrbrau1/18826/Bobra.0841s0006.1